MAGSTRRCECSVHGCDRHTDPQTGERGWPLDLKMFKRHQLDEQTSQKTEQARLAMEARHAVLAAQERNIEETFSNLSIRPPGDNIAREPKYKADYKRRLISDISRWEEKISELSAEIEDVGVPPEGMLSGVLTRQALSRCLRIQQSFGRISGDLKIVKSGSLRKEASIALMLQNIEDMLGGGMQHVDTVTQLWKSSLVLVENLEKEAAQQGMLLDSSKHFENPFANASPLVQLSSLMVVACHVILGLSRRGCGWLFAMCSILIEAVFSWAGAPQQLTATLIQLLRKFPKDVRSSTTSFRLDGKSTIYAVCPKCDQTYKPDIVEERPTYPHRCNSSQYSSRCGEILVRPKTVKNHQIFVPIKPYIVFDFPDWLGGLLSRSGYEEMMDKAWDRMGRSADGAVDDIFQGSIIQELKGPDGETHFSQAGPDQYTGRYLFSLGCDFFNPLRNLANGKRVSIGIIALVCLNLPISIRYKPENMFLAGIIPGPKEPSLDAINPYLQPIVDAFKRFWHGVRYTRTLLFESGRWVICALIAIICDLPAGRKVGGFAACSHEYFCSFCWCSKTVHSLANFDHQSWRLRTGESCRTWAENFRNAPNEKQAKSSFDRSGLRWSALLQLPYFDACKHVVVDPMHNLFLGLIKEHFQGILGYLPKGVKPKNKFKHQDDELGIVVSPSTSNPIPEKPAEKASVRRLVSFLQRPLQIDASGVPDKKALMDLLSKRTHLAALVYLGKAFKCIPDTVQPNGSDSSQSKKWSKAQLITNIVEWRLQLKQEESTSLLGSNSCHGVNGRVFTEHEMLELWADIEKIVQPSWATSVPNNISSSCAKLKSDQWRAIGALFLPVTLIRLWSTVDEDDPRSKARKDLLNLTMSLCSAINIASSRTTSPEHARLYLEHMSEYRRQLQEIFPGYNVHPNHHMAMHIGEFTIMYGPIHGWWTYPFERVIGRLQRIMTNYKQGEYEATIGRSWTRAANLQALFLKSWCPSAIKLCAKAFQKFAHPQGRNALNEYVGHAPDADQAEDLFELDEESASHSTNAPQTLSPDVQKAFREYQPQLPAPTSAIIKNRLTINGISYTTSDIHEGNSGILCHDSHIPFSIVGILELPGYAQQPLGQHWLVVRRYQHADVEADPYREYPHIRARLWGVGFHRSLEVLPLVDVKTHFAKLVTMWEGKQVAVIVSLAKSHLL